MQTSAKELVLFAECSRYSKKNKMADILDGEQLNRKILSEMRMQMYDNCWLGGSPAMRADAVLFLEATKQLGTMLNSCRSSLKNL